MATETLTPGVQMDQYDVTSTNEIDLEISVDAPSLVSLDVSSPSASEVSLKRQMVDSDNQADLWDSADTVGVTSSSADEIYLRPGQKLILASTGGVDGAKRVDAIARRVPR